MTQQHFSISRSKDASIALQKITPDQLLGRHNLDRFSDEAIEVAKRAFILAPQVIEMDLRTLTRYHRCPSESRPDLIHFVEGIWDEQSDAKKSTCTCEYSIYHNFCKHILSAWSWITYYKPLIGESMICIPHQGVYMAPTPRNRCAAYYTSPDGLARNFELKHIWSDENYYLIVPEFYRTRYPELKRKQ